MSKSIDKISERKKALENLERYDSQSYDINNIMESAKKAYLDGDPGFAAALLARGSQYCEDNGLMQESIVMLAAAERLLCD